MRNGFHLLSNLNSEIRSQQSLEWLTRPGSQQLGAKWVEVNGGVRGRQNQPKERI